MQEKKKSKPRNGLVYLTFALMVLALAFGFKKNSDYNKLEEVFIKEKTELKNELDELIDDYKDVKIQNKNLSARLNREMDKIISLRDSVKNLADKDYDVILQYRKRVRTLERENHDLFAQVDSLKLVNKDLKHENVVVVEQLKQKTELLEDIKDTNEDLESIKQELQKKVDLASIVNVSPINAFAMKERSSGKLTTTSRSRKTDAFKIHFKVLENQIRSHSKMPVLIQVLDANGNVVRTKGTDKLVDGSELTYSDKLIIDYENKSVDLLSLILVNRDDIKKGNYEVKVFVDGRQRGKTVINLR